VSSLCITLAKPVSADRFSGRVKNLIFPLNLTNRSGFVTGVLQDSLMTFTALNVLTAFIWFLF